MKIAVAGKIGVGKTFLVATLARIYAEEGRNVLVADADPVRKRAEHILKINMPNLQIMFDWSVKKGCNIFLNDRNEVGCR